MSRSTNISLPNCTVYP